MKKISARLKGIRLKQNISRQDLSESSGVSVSSIVRMEDGEIKSFDSFLRVLRILGKMDILLPLVEEEELSPNEYFNAVQAANSIAAELKVLRKENGMTQVDLAMKSGVGLNFVRELEQGKATVRMDKVAKVFSNLKKKYIKLFPAFCGFIDSSFLDAQMKADYQTLLAERLHIDAFCY